MSPSERSADGPGSTPPGPPTDDGEAGSSSVSVWVLLVKYAWLVVIAGLIPASITHPEPLGRGLMTAFGALLVFQAYYIRRYTHAATDHGIGPGFGGVWAPAYVYSERWLWVVLVTDVAFSLVLFGAAAGLWT